MIEQQIAPIELCSKRKAYFVGKPNPIMMHTGLFLIFQNQYQKLTFSTQIDLIFKALRKLGCLSNETAMIGDRMDTDIVGAVESNIDSLLVLSGVTTIEEISHFAFQPTHILNGLSDLKPFH